MARSKGLRVTVCGAVVAALGGVVPAAAAAGAVASSPPRIVARPNDVMVNTKVDVVGTGFPARRRLSVKECSSTGWVVVAQRPCDTDNAISVVTDSHGRFARKFRVELCPRASTTTGPVNREICYIGNPQPRGVDTISLVGAARVTVTYP